MGFLGDALDFVDDAVDSGTKFVAKGLRKGGHLAGEALDAAGLHGAGQTVSGWGDDIADDAGVKVAERNLDESDDPKELLHGDAKRLNEVAGHLQKFHDAFEKAGQGLTRLDTDHWKGEAADHFRRDFDPQPKQWLAAADAFAKASAALTTYAHTVGWAQDQAKDAVRIWKEAQKKTDAAAKTFMSDAMTYDLRLKAYNATPADQRQGNPPAKPGEFAPPADAVAQFKEAEGKLNAARTQRNAAARTALAAVKTLVASAPAMPSRTEILKADLMDTATSVPQFAVHFGGGVVKSAVDLNKLLRSVNPLDPYNATHPAEYATGLSGLLAGLSGSANNPAEAVKGLVGSGWGSDPAEAGGRLFGNLLLAPETGGGSVAAGAAEREATAVAENAARNTAKEAAENAAKEAAEKSSKAPVTSPTTPTGAAEAAPVKNYTPETVDATAGHAANIPSQKVPHPVQPVPNHLSEPSPRSDFATGPVKPKNTPPPLEKATAPDAVHKTDVTPSESPKQTYVDSHSGGASKTPGSSPNSDFATGPVKPEGAHPSVDPPAEPGAGHGGDATPTESPKHTHPEDHAGAETDAGSHDGQASDHAGSTGDPSATKDIHGAADRTPGPHMSQEDFSRLAPEDQMTVAWSETSQGAKTFKDNLEAERYGADYWNHYVEGLPESQKEAVNAYTGDYFTPINGYLRSGGYISPANMDRISEIDAALAGRPIPETVMVSRGTNLGYIGMSPPQMVGKIFAEDGFTSASLGESPFSYKDAMLHLKVPEGTPGLWVEKVGEYENGEREILLGRGTNWRVDRVVVRDNGKYDIYGEILP
ncbi:putative T7SS-secreted protein [Kitasatospora sp. NPDC096077]|uniref:putative T7SS-secreted protein n=1 Tax=Kitasatospora sp. NPDC096077 TaxID=3155544 RepID=UPI003330DAC1